MTTQRSSGETTEILIAEDSPTQAAQLQHMLENQGYIVTAAANGRQALARLRIKKPDLVITDVVMPEMDGYELCSAMKSDPEFVRIPIILVTTLSDPGDVIRGLECGADNFIVKPYDERYLLSRVQFILLNREMDRGNENGTGVEIYFNGAKHSIQADRLQILNLLLSTYEAAIEKNKILTTTQAELRHSNGRLENAFRELESFSYSVSHDLRAPLRRIKGFADLLQSAAGEALPVQARDHLARIVAGSEEMDRLIVDLLEFSRLSRVELRESRIDMNALVREVVASSGETGRTIHWSVQPLPDVIGDGAILKQAFVNLISNAVKYTRGRNPAEIEIGVEGQEDGFPVIFIRDNGAGFDMRYADKLFGVFNRLHRADEFEGTGIGLANVRRIIDRHGGRTWAFAKPGEGATFFVTLKPAPVENLG